MRCTRFWHKCRPIPYYLREKSDGEKRERETEKENENDE